MIRVLTIAGWIGSIILAVVAGAGIERALHTPAAKSCPVPAPNTTTGAALRQAQQRALKLIEASLGTEGGAQ